MGVAKKLIYYRRLPRYKYSTTRNYVVSTPIRSKHVKAIGDFVSLAPDGTLSLAAGYAWDGASGPAIDTKNFMRGSLVHDAFYQLMRASELSHHRWRRTADRLLRAHCIEDGMSRIRAAWVYGAVRAFGERAARPRKLPPERSAP